MPMCPVSPKGVLLMTNFNYDLTYFNYDLTAKWLILIMTCSNSAKWLMRSFYQKYDGKCDVSTSS